MEKGFCLKQVFYALIKFGFGYNLLHTYIPVILISPKMFRGWGNVLSVIKIINFLLSFIFCVSYYLLISTEVHRRST